MKYCRRLFIFFCFLLVYDNCFAQNPENPTFRLYLIGDAGEDDTTENTLLDLGRKLRENPNSAVIFLGDNCYRKAMFGLLPFKVKGYDGSKIAKARIKSQLNILEDYKGYAYFIPGNHE